MMRLSFDKLELSPRPTSLSPKWSSCTTKMSTEFSSYPPPPSFSSPRSFFFFLYPALPKMSPFDSISLDQTSMSGCPRLVHQISQSKPPSPAPTLPIRAKTSGSEKKPGYYTPGILLIAWW